MRKLNTFHLQKDLKFGDFILFQEYTQKGDDMFDISCPILAIYLGSFVADQAIGFNYVKYINEDRVVYITNEHVTNYPVQKEVDKIDSHIEWSDFIDILGHWKHKPNWKEIIYAYRKYNKCSNIKGDEITV